MKWCCRCSWPNGSETRTNRKDNDTEDVIAMSSNNFNRNEGKFIKYIVKGGVPFFWTHTLFLLYTSTRVTIPIVVEETTGWYLFYFVNFIFIEAVVNWFLISRIKKISKRDLSQAASGEWKNCDRCQTVAPPRSHHCPICDTCILRRDHHCYFTGSCIGHSNQRRFIVLLVYLVLGSVLGFVLNIMYVNMKMPLKSEFMYYLPMLSLYRYLFTGDLSAGLLLILLQGYLCVFTLVSACGYLAVEIVLTVKGQTQFESDKNIVTYRQSVIQNIRAVFGSLWLLPIHFILPISIPLPNTWETPKIK